ncbi:MAG TPA: hypothetical protein QGG93_03410 [Verrucomicrobiota bacterium]|nr:hypothetical protein [Verrucomicrobiota bacterium]|tara:strand:- start:9 stop:416 length:408 start_codon:yes stop_codon:yes gene_type:complete
MEQITIVTKDYNGLTADITSALGSNDINIESLDAKKIDDVGVVMLRVDQYDRAQHVLNDAGWNPITEDALLVRVKDEPGAIAHLAKRFQDADLHVSSMRIVQHHGDWGAISVCAEPLEKARTLVKDELLAGCAGD